MEKKFVNKLKITTIVEDTCPLKGFKGEHGLSFWIEADDKKILFDTGQSGDVLLHNAQILGLNIRKADALVLSHPHYDHQGGISLIAESVKKLPLYCTSNILNQETEIFKEISNICFVTKNLEIFPGIYLPQERDTVNYRTPTKEINLVINLEKKGLVIIVGCAHHGLTNIINDAMKLFNGKIPIYALIGGLHLKDANKKEITEILKYFKKTGLKKLAPNHCTGFEAIKIISQNYPEIEIIKTVSGTFHTGQVLEL